MHQPKARPIPHAEVMDRLLEAERQLADLHQEVEHLHRLSTVGTLAAGVVHEINNALTPLLSYAQLAAAAPGDDALGRQVVQKAIAAVDRVTQITDAILGFVRPDALDSPADRVADVGACIDDVFSCMGRSSGCDGVRTVVEAPMGCRVRMRPVALQQVLLNLILNAHHAMAGLGSGTLTIRAECSTWEGGPKRKVRIAVSDTGPGISDDVAPRLFEPFVTSRGGSGGGNGLGLAVCRRLLTEAGGRIWAERAPEGGAMFVMEVWGDGPSDPSAAAA